MKYVIIGKKGYTGEETETRYPIRRKKADFMVKRKILYLLMAIILCLGLCACNPELPAEQLEQLYGTWIADTAFDSSGKTVDGAAYLITFAEDGQFRLGDEGGMTWTAKAVKDSMDLEVTIRANKKAVYQFTATVDENGMQLGLLTDQKGETSFGGYLRTSTQVSKDWADDLFTQWYPAEENGQSFPIGFRADGTCTVDGKAYNWIVYPDWDFSGSDGVTLLIHDRMQSLYCCPVTKNSTGVLSFELLAKEDLTRINTYRNNPLINILTHWKRWFAFDKSNGLSRSISVDSETLNFSSGINLPWQMGENCPEGTLIAYVPNAEAPDYVLTMTMNGDYPQLALEDKVSGDVVSFYQSAYGYDPANPEAVYYDAVSAINSYLDNGTYWNETLESELYDDEILGYAYARFQEVADYKESQTYLNRFTIYPNKLVSVTRKYIDKLENQKETTDYRYYSYDTAGRLWHFFDPAYEYVYGITELWNNPAYLEYDANGIVRGITVKSGYDIKATGIPAYDEAGGLAGMQVWHQTGQYTTYFTANSQGQTEQVEVTYYKAPFLLEYTYDEAGKVIQTVLSNDSLNHVYQVTTDYVYGNGVLTQKIENYYEDWSGVPPESWTVTHTYTNDANGNPLSVKIVSTKPDREILSEEHIYHYRDVYFYAGE